MKNKFKLDSHSNIGYWSVDHAGLPVFIYTGKIPYGVVVNKGEKITYPEDPWFLLGNYTLTAFVHTSGVFDIYTLRRAWGRLNVETSKQPTNQSTIKIDQKEYHLSGLESVIACNAKKEFGTGFASFKMEIDDTITCDRTIAVMPSEKINTGNPALFINVKLTNKGTHTKKILFSESVLANYRMLNENRISYKAHSHLNKDYISASFDPYFEASIEKTAKEKASTYDFYPPELFIRTEENASYSRTDHQDDTVTLRAGCELNLHPGETKILRYVVGFKYDQESIVTISDTLFRKGKTDEKFRRLWKEKLPDYSYLKDEIIKREQYWNTYVLEASAKYNEYFEETFIPQGMTYDYVWGLNAVARDHLHYSLPANYFNPNLSKSIIRFVLKQMNPNGYFHYNVNGYGYAVPNLWNPSDLQLHLFWAVAEYLEKTEDHSFLKETTVYYPKRIKYKASVLEKLKAAFDYLNDEIATGPHGLIKMLNADWNDQIWNEQPITIYYPTAESHYNASMAIVVLKQLTEQLEKAANDPQLSEEKPEIDKLVERIALYRDKQLHAYLKDLGKRNFAKRAYYNEELSIGDEHMHIESQLYTLMMDDIPLEQKERIVKETTKRLSNKEILGVRTTEKKVSDTFEAGTHENGGIWMYVQGMYALGLLHVDIKKADNAIEKMSFENFAKNYPDYWPGQWTGADTVNSSLAKYPGLVSENGSVYMDFPTYCAHAHSWPLLYQFKRKEKSEDSGEL